MIHHQLGHATEAKEWLDKATSLLGQFNSNNPKDPASGLSISWNVWVAVQALREEAERMNRSEKP